MLKRKHSKVIKARDFCKMEKNAQRAMIQYLHKKGLAAKDIHTDMVTTQENDMIQ